ncbi:MAG TPA: DnaB-like helicase C-terminal domain-containing protein [Bacilli bacterium]|nr:DnaB-like helicase C-terminal domain-containing protein [Bacilli bacterium]
MNIYDELTEKALLGKLLNDPEGLARIDGLAADDFYTDYGKIVFSAILNITRTGQTADILSVSNYLRISGDLEKIGGGYFLTELTEGFISSALIKQDSDRLIDFSNRRRIYQSLIESSQRLEAGAGLSEVTESVLSAFQEIEDKDGGSFKHISDATDGLIDELDALMAGKTSAIPTGFYDLDNKIEGLRPSDVIIVGAKTSIGKTLFALNVALNVLKLGFPVGLISLEMSKNQIARRLICANEKIDSSKLRPGKVDTVNKQYLKGIEHLQQLPLFIQDLPSGKAFRILTAAEYLVKIRGIRLLIIDHLQLLSGGKSESRNLELGEISRAIKLFALKNKIPVMVLSQMNRRSGESGMPALSELRDSGSIEQDADVVLLLNRFSKEDKNGKPAEYLKVKIGKNRHGQTGELDLLCYLNEQRLETPYENRGT